MIRLTVLRRWIAAVMAALVLGHAAAVAVAAQSQSPALRLLVSLFDFDEPVGTTALAQTLLFIAGAAAFLAISRVDRAQDRRWRLCALAAALLGLESSVRIHDVLPAALALTAPAAQRWVWLTTGAFLAAAAAGYAWPLLRRVRPPIATGFLAAVAAYAAGTLANLIPAEGLVALALRSLAEEGLQTSGAVLLVMSALAHLRDGAQA